MIKEDRFVHAKRKHKGKNKGKNKNNGNISVSSVNPAAQTGGKKKEKTPEQLNAAQGKFPFTEINGFQLREVEWTVPDSDTRKRRRRAFNKVREEFLKHIGTTMEPALRDMGLTDKQIQQVKKGSAPMGYNVHHKLPIHGGGQNVFSNLILMPIGPHDELHHKVMDPQVANMQTGDSKKVIIPWTDDMVYVSPERKRSQPQKAVLIAKAMENRLR